MPNMEKFLRKNFTLRDAGAGFLLAVLGLLIPQFILGIIWAAGTTFGGWRDFAVVQAQSFGFLIISGAALQLILGLVYFLYTRNVGADPIRAPRLQNMPARNWLLAAAAGIAALFGLMFTSFSFDLLFTGVFGYQQPDLPAVDTAGKVILAVIFMGVLPAFFEELIFRGVILRGLAPLGRTKAVLISAAAFAMAHMSPAQTVHQFLLGIVMALLAWETGSILAPMLIHFINNALSIVLDVSGFGGLIQGLKDWEIIVIALVTLCAVCGIIYFILRFVKKPPQDETPLYAPAQNGETVVKKKLTDDKRALFFLTAGFVITAVVWITAMFF